MISGMCLSQTHALIAPRIYPFGKALNNFFHCLWLAASAATAVAGISTAVHYKNYYGKLSNLSSAHSFSGLYTLSMFFLTNIYGILSFVFTDFTIFGAKIFPKLYKTLGLLTLYCATMTIEMGITQRDNIFGCDFAITRELDAAAHYSEILRGCRLSNGMGFMILLNAVLVSYALWDFPEQ